MPRPLQAGFFLNREDELDCATRSASGFLQTAHRFQQHGATEPIIQRPARDPLAEERAIALGHGYSVTHSDSQGIDFGLRCVPEVDHAAPSHHRGQTTVRTVNGHRLPEVEIVVPAASRCRAHGSGRQHARHDATDLVHMGEEHCDRIAIGSQPHDHVPEFVGAGTVGKCGWH